MFESMRIYIERHGRAFNYLPSIEHAHIERLAKLENAETDANKDSEIEAKQVQISKDQEVERLEKLAQDRIKGIEEHVKKEGEVKDMRLREYLMRYLVPTLSDGMIDVCKVAPIDPVDYLAEYIFKADNGEKEG